MVYRAMNVGFGLLSSMTCAVLLLGGCEQNNPMSEPPPGVVLGLSVLENSTVVGVDESGHVRVFNRDGNEFIDEAVSEAAMGAVAATGDLIAAGDDDGQVHVFRVQGDSLQQLAEFRVTSAGVTSLAWQPGRDDRLAVGSADGIIRVYDPFTGVRIGQQLVGHQPRAVLSLAFGPEDTAVSDWLVSGGNDATFRIYESDAENSVPRRARTPGTNAVNAVAVTPDGTLLVTAIGDGRTRLWRTQDAFEEDGAPTSNWTQLQTLFGHFGAVNAAVLSPDGAFLFTGGEDGAVIVWDMVEFEMVTDYREGRGGAVRAISVSEENGEIAVTVAGGDGSIVVEFFNNAS